MMMIAGQLLFLATLGLAGWTIVSTIRPQFDRIAMLLTQGAAADMHPALPAPAMVRGRPVRVRQQPARKTALRAAA